MRKGIKRKSNLFKIKGIKESLLTFLGVISIVFGMIAAIRIGLIFL